MFQNYQDHIDSIKDDDTLTFDEKTRVIWIYTFTLAGVTLFDWVFIKPFHIIGWVFVNLSGVLVGLASLYGFFILSVIIYLAVIV